VPGLSVSGGDGGLGDGVNLFVQRASAAGRTPAAAAADDGRVAPGTGRRPVLTLADRLLATVLHQRLALPQVAFAALFGIRPETINKRIRDIRQLVDQAGYAIEPGSHRLDDLYRYASQRTSSSHQRSRRRVNDLQALMSAARSSAWLPKLRSELAYLCRIGRLASARACLFGDRPHPKCRATEAARLNGAARRAPAQRSALGSTPGPTPGLIGGQPQQDAGSGTLGGELLTLLHAKVTHSDRPPRLVRAVPGQGGFVLDPPRPERRCRASLT